MRASHSEKRLQRDRPRTNCCWNEQTGLLVSLPVSKTPVAIECCSSQRIIIITSGLFLPVLSPIHSQIPSPTQTPGQGNPRTLNDHGEPASRGDADRKSDDNAAIATQGQQSDALPRFSDRNERTTLHISLHRRHRRRAEQHSKSPHSDATATQIRRRKSSSHRHHRRGHTSLLAPSRDGRRRVETTQQRSSHRHRRQADTTPSVPSHQRHDHHVDTTLQILTPIPPPRRQATAYPVTPTPLPNTEDMTSEVTPTRPPRRYTPSPIIPTPPQRRYETPSPATPTRPPPVNITASPTIPSRPPVPDITPGPIQRFPFPIPNLQQAQRYLHGCHRVEITPRALSRLPPGVLRLKR